MNKLLILITLVCFYSNMFAQNDEDKPLCTDISRGVDDYTDDITFVVEVPRGYGIRGMYPIFAVKTISKTKTSYSLSFYTYSDFLSSNRTDVAVLFTDGTKWLKSTRIKTDIGSSGVEYEYSASFSLTQADLITFSTKAIKKFRLHIFEEEIIPYEAEKFQIYMKCLLKAK